MQNRELETVLGGSRRVNAARETRAASSMTRVGEARVIVGTDLEALLS